MRQTGGDRCCLPSGNRHESLSLFLSFSVISFLSCPVAVHLSQLLGILRVFFLGQFHVIDKLEIKSNQKKKKKKQTKDKSNTARLSQIWVTI
jgi:hypothetical protein